MRNLIAFFRRDAVAVVGLACVAAAGIASLARNHFFQVYPPREDLVQQLTWLVLGTALGAILLGGVAVWRLGRTGEKADRVIAAIVLAAGTLLLIRVLTDCTGCRKPHWLRARDDARTAVTQAIVYAKDYGVYPNTIAALREKGYANIRDQDPWDAEWVLAPALVQGAKPKVGDDIYVYSKGPCRTGTYTPGRKDTGKCGAVGYSGLHGEFQGSEY